MNYPTLYKKTQTGAIQSWSIAVDSNVITTCFGHLFGKQQILSETIETGKNIGKTNETTSEQQAAAEARSRWEKQLKKGYARSKEEAENKATDSQFIHGGVAPMLAPSKVFGTDERLTKKIKYPAYVQPKLDGMRCIAVIESGEVSLWSRTRKPIQSVPHIVDALRKWAADLQARGGLGDDEKLILDGELYNHSYKDRFGKLMSILRKDAPDNKGKHLDAQYHVYDTVTNKPFRERYRYLHSRSAAFSGPLCLVSTFVATSEEEVFSYFEQFKKDGYEGAMVRNSDATYSEDKRSPNLQKVKGFDEDEFDIVQIKTGRGKFSDAAIFVLTTRDGKTFDCAAPGSIEERGAFLKDEDSWKGKKLTIKYQGLTDASGVPRFPVAKAIRDYE